MSDGIEITEELELKFSDVQEHALMREIQGIVGSFRRRWKREASDED